MSKSSLCRSIFALAVGITLCSFSYGAPTVSAAGGFNPIAVMGNQSWSIDGTIRKIDATYYLNLQSGLQFTIEVSVNQKPPNQELAMEAAWPYIRYAYVSKNYLRSNITKDMRGSIVPTRIGVALVLHRGIMSTGRRVAMSIDQIKSRLNKEKPGG